MHFQPVGLQAHPVGEALATHLALVWLLPSVDPLVCPEGLLARELLSADRARVGPLLRVQLHMPLEVSRLQEPAVAERACVWPVAGVVPPLVLAEGAVVGKRLAALLAEVGRFAGVCSLVALETWTIFKRFATCRATVPPFLRVGSGVLPESAGFREGLRTLGA